MRPKPMGEREGEGAVGGSGGGGIAVTGGGGDGARREQGRARSSCARLSGSEVASRTRETQLRQSAASEGTDVERMLSWKQKAFERPRNRRVAVRGQAVCQNRPHLLDGHGHSDKLAR